MSNAVQFNAANGNRYTGKNLEVLLEAKQELGFSGNRWVTYSQAQELGLVKKEALGASGLRGRSTGLRGFAKKGNKTEPFWFRVFNLDDFETKQAKGLKSKANAAKAAPKASKPSKKAAAKKTSTKSAPVSTFTVDANYPATPVADKEGVYIVRDTDGNFREVNVLVS